MSKKIKIKIDDREFLVEEGKTIMEVAHENGIEIPNLCHHPDLEVKANCRVCVVEIKGQDKLKTSCSTLAEDGMEVETNSPKVKNSRDANLELIFAEHVEKCSTCVWRFECPLLKYAKKYNILVSRFPERKEKRKTYKFANAVEIDGSQCIDCRNCIEVCSVVQNINYLELKGKGINQEIKPTDKKDFHCILCGQCTLHCPVNAAQEQTQWEEVEKHISDPEIITVAQFAPSIRVSIGEDFDMPYGELVTENIVSSLKMMGFDYVFDVNFGADLTTIIEAEELIERIKDGGEIPMYTSCCPGWVNYVEHYHPELIPNLTTSRSPHIHSAGVIKTYWARQMKIDPKKIRVISIMPCTAKKYEAIRPEMKIKGMLPVDNVITTREFSFMLKKNNIDLKKVKKQKADNPLGEYSGGAAIFGGSGGVMESALRTVDAILCAGQKSKICKSRIDFKEVRGLEDVKEAEVEVGGIKLKVAVVNGIGNVEKVIENQKKYDYIEVMACPGGCIGGGGQPIPTTEEIRKKRIVALYSHDKKLKIRRSSDNKKVAEVIKWIKDEGLSEEVFYTKYEKRIGY
jgi:iron-only hydrogenase group A